MTGNVEVIKKTFQVDKVQVNRGLEKVKLWSKVVEAVGNF